MNLAIWLKRTALAGGTRGALYHGEDLIADYGTFFARASAVASALRDRAVEPGDRVALVMKNLARRDAETTEEILGRAETVRAALRQDSL